MATNIMRNDATAMDRLTFSRAQHLKTHNNRVKSVSDDELDAISDWSESDRECCPLSDFESTSNVDGLNDNNRYDIPFEEFDDDEVDRRSYVEPAAHESVLNLNDPELLNITDSLTNTCISYSYEAQHIKEQQQQEYIQERIRNTLTRKPSMNNDKQYQPPLLPARRMTSKQVSPRRTTPNTHVLPPTTTTTTLISRHQKTTTLSPTRYCLRRETTSTSINSNSPVINDQPVLGNSSFHSQDENPNHQRYVASPNLSQTSICNGHIPRVYELKKLYADDYDYGRLTDLSAVKSIPPRNRQKWGTIVHPPFPLGYQQASSEQVSQAVQRLTSPARCRDRHTPVQTPSKRYLSVEETDALINRLTKVKSIRSSEQYWPVQRQSRPVKNLSNPLKTNNHNWKGVGISA